MRYLTRRPLMVLAFKDNHHAAISIAPGRFIDVAGPAVDDRFLVVTIEGEDFHAFVADVESCCERAADHSAHAVRA